MHHRLDGHEFEQAPGDGDGEGSLACCSQWGHRSRHEWVTKLNWLGETHSANPLQDELDSGKKLRINRRLLAIQK